MNKNIVIGGITCIIGIGVIIASVITHNYQKKELIRTLHEEIAAFKNIEKSNAMITEELREANAIAKVLMRISQDIRNPEN
jgi:hypothetical protein